jgi:hypothetical protein
MSAGRDIIDALECVLSIYFSNVRHHIRAAFLLCDEMVEVACKAKLKRAHPNMGRIGFFGLLQHQVVGLDPTVPGLGESLMRNHDTRNHMQHAVAAATVDDQHCADAILDAVAAIEHCFPGTTAGFTDSIRVAIRIIRVHSSEGSQKLRADFDEEMRRFRWNHPPRRSTTTTVPIAVGTRQQWGQVVMSNNVIIDGMLDSIGAA